MKFRTVYGILPVLIFYPDIKDAHWTAKQNGPFIRIREFKDDEGVARHEMTHVKQFYRMLLIFHPFLYLLWPWYRLRSEVEAFREQLKWDPSDLKQKRLEQYANLLSTAYKVNVTFEEARELLRR